MAYGTWTLTGLVVALDGTPTLGASVVRVEATVPEIRDASGNIVLAGRLTVPVDPTAQTWTVTLPANDPSLSPSGFGFDVRVVSSEGMWDKRIPAQPAGTVLDWADITTSVLPVPVGEVAVTTASLDGLTAARIGQPGSSTAAVLNSTFGLATRSVTFDPDRAGAMLPRGPQTLVTPDGSGQVTHASVVYIAEGWNGYRWWLAATPYPSAQTRLENPCIWASDDGETWVVPAGVTNPIEAAPAAQTGYNSDPHLVYVAAERRLYCFWRAFDPGFNPADERIYYRAATEGDLSFSTRQVVLVNDSTVRRLYSPAVRLVGGVWHMWAASGLDSPMAYVHLTAPTPTGPWTEPVACTFDLAWPTGREPWHLDVQYHDGRYYALMMDNDIDSSGGAGDLYFAVSTDAVAWRRSPGPVMPRTSGYVTSWYRSCMTLGYRDGQIGWDVFVTSVGAGGSGQRRMGRTFLRFDGADPEPVQHVRRIIEAKSGLAPYKIADTFNRADGAVGTADAGGAWQVYTGSPQVIGNKLAVPLDGNVKMVLDTGETDVFVEATLSALPTLGAQFWLMLRAADASNYYRLGYSSVPMVQKIVAGAATTISAFTYGAQIGAFPIRIGARIRGSQIQVFVHGAPYGAPITDTTFSSGTRHGMQFDKAGVQVDDYYCRALVNGA